MERYSIYNDIARRTDGDIYIGVVGPVRTGKSTFIKRFMEQLVLPGIDNPNKRERAIDELPQSAAGKTIMTTEPKFVPNEAAEITLSDNSILNVRLIDCVGYMVEGALGSMEADIPRMVRTPWLEEEMPFDEAAEMGTRKVINEHSTIGLVITCDGSFGEIERDSYIEAEERVISELMNINKPFVMLLNSRRPLSEETTNLSMDLEAKYGVPVIAVNCMELNEVDIKEIMEEILFVFPVKEINLNMPKWLLGLSPEHWLKKSIYDTLTKEISSVTKICEISDAIANVAQNEYIKNAKLTQINLGEGSANVDITLNDDLFYKVISEETGFDITDESKIISMLKELAEVKYQYDKIAYALEEVRNKGYGIVTPTIDELKLEEPEIVKHGGRFGVKLKASAPSIHMIRADIETEVSPIVGSEKQSEELVKYLLSEFEENPKKIWESNIFGKSLHELVNEGLQNKLSKTPEDARAKLQETLQRIINEGSGGLICIIL